MYHLKVEELAKQIQPVLEEAVNLFYGGESVKKSKLALFFEATGVIHKAVGIAMSAVELMELSGDAKKSFVLSAFEFAYSKLDEKFKFPDSMDRILLMVIIPEAVEQIFKISSEAQK